MLLFKRLSRILTIILIINVLFIINCSDKKNTEEKQNMNNSETKSKDAEKQEINPNITNTIIEALIKEHGIENKERITVGVKQVTSLWRKDDGSIDELKDFCIKNFIKNEEDLKAVFMRFQNNYEQINGHLNEVRRILHEPSDLDKGPILPIDKLFAEYNLESHVISDLFKTKVAFIILLNFKDFTLEEKLQYGTEWSRLEWAYARLAGVFSSRVPQEIKHKVNQAYVTADDYISNYNIYMNHLISKNDERLFPENLKLISHWGLRDELKAQYSNKDGLEKQKLIAKVMEKIISQEIPKDVIDNPNVDWNVETNEVKPSTAKDYEADKFKDKQKQSYSTETENYQRYKMLLNIFLAEKEQDKYFPTMPSFIDRKFKKDREILEDDVVNLLTSILASPVVGQVSKYIEKQLGRKLEAFDIWYNGFKARGKYSEDDLDKVVAKKYPTVESFQKDLPAILTKLGFDDANIKLLTSKITVDPSRGAGHAMGAERREDNAHLRTRVQSTGMNYKGFNIGIHELGHNVEQVFSLNKMDYYLLKGVPNTAFTECFAFVFQTRDMELLGFEQKDSKLESMRILDRIWSLFEISGVAIVDIGIWKWMYQHPEATPKDVKEAMIKIARDVWNKYYFPIFGVRDSTLLAVYSHIIDAGMYIPDYPIGYIIQSQVEDYLKNSSIAKEMERMCTQGQLTPDNWMKTAVGNSISTDAIIRATEEALLELEKN